MRGWTTPKTEPTPPLGLLSRVRAGAPHGPTDRPRADYANRRADRRRDRPPDGSPRQSQAAVTDFTWMQIYVLALPFIVLGVVFAVVWLTRP